MQPTQTGTDVDILLVGQTGMGKSATGNSIIGRRVFKSEFSMNSVTKKIQFEYAEFEGKILKVVDGPGVGDTELNSKEAIKLVVDTMSVAIAANPDGYHVILLLVRVDARFTKESMDSILVLKRIFGENFIEYHSILLFTRGDSFSHENSSTQQSFYQWLDEQTGPIHDIFQECGKRVILFDNVTKDENVKNLQRRQLLSMIGNLTKSGNRYTSEVFQKAKQSRERLFRESSRPQLHDSFLMQFGLITQQLSKTDFQRPAAELPRLHSLMSTIEQLEKDVQKQDNGTNALSVAIMLTNQLKQTASEQLNQMQELISKNDNKEDVGIACSMDSFSLETEKKRKEQSTMAEEPAIKEERETQWKEEIRQKEEELEREQKEPLRNEKKENKRKQEEFERQQKLLDQKAEELRKTDQQIQQKLQEQKEDELRKKQELDKRLQLLEQKEEKCRNDELQMKMELKDKELKIMTEELSKKIDSIQILCDKVKQEQTTSWWSAAATVAAPVYTAVSKWWFGGK